MGFLGSAVGSITDAITGQKSGTTLEDFLSKYTSSEGKYVDSLDPLSTFDIKMKFYPTLELDNLPEQSMLDRLTETAEKLATKAANNFLNNVTGGIAGSLMNKNNVKEEHDSFSKIRTHTFLEYLAKASLIVGGDNWFSSSIPFPLEIELGPYVQEVTIPQIVMAEGEKITTPIGEFQTNGQFVKTDSNNLLLQVVNTRTALHERIFYPWMKEVSLPYWSYDTEPYTTATVTVDFTKHNDVEYVFFGCRPTQIYTMQGKQDTQSADNIVRQITLTFDFMAIKSKLTNIDSWGSKLMSSIGPIAKSAATAIKL